MSDLGNRRMESNRRMSMVSTLRVSALVMSIISSYFLTSAKSWPSKEEPQLAFQVVFDCLPRVYERRFHERCDHVSQSTL